MYETRLSRTQMSFETLRFWTIFATIFRILKQTMKLETSPVRVAGSDDALLAEIRNLNHDHCHTFRVNYHLPNRYIILEMSGGSINRCTAWLPYGRRVSIPRARKSEFFNLSVHFYWRYTEFLTADWPLEFASITEQMVCGFSHRVDNTCKSEGLFARTGLWGTGCRRIENP